MDKYVIGVDIGGTNTVIGLVNKEGKVVSRDTLATQTYTDGAIFVMDIAKSIIKLKSFHDVEIGSVGVGAPNANFVSGCIESNTANLRIKEEIPICKILEKELNVPTVLSNDADAAAIGEHIYGSAKNCSNFILVTLGTGVGSGFFADGHLIHGHNCMAGELGHLTLYPEGRECSCGRCGCLETYTSARGICQTFKELAKKSNNIDNINTENITSKDIGELANEGNPLALKTFEITAKYLAIGLANAVTFSNPEKIILMGGPTKVGAPLLIPLKRYFKDNLLFIYENSVTIEFSQLDDNDAAILGAAALINLKN